MLTGGPTRFTTPASERGCTTMAARSGIRIAPTSPNTSFCDDTTTRVSASVSGRIRVSMNIPEATLVNGRCGFRNHCVRLRAGWLLLCRKSA
jgi:hypothetical protein